MENTLFKRKINVNDAITPLMVSGVLEKEYPGELDGGKMTAYAYAALDDAVKELGKKRFKEFDDFEFFGMKGKWRICDTPAPRYADGRYYVTDRLAVMPIYVELESDCDQDISIKTDERRIIAVLNGETVYDTRNESMRNPKLSERVYKRLYVFEHPPKPNCEIMKMRLKKGSNSLLLLTGHVSKSTGIQFDMQLHSAEAPICAHVPLNMPEDIRTEIFESYQRTHVTDDIYYDGIVPSFKIGNWPLKSCTVKCTVTGNNGIKIEEPPINGDGICELPETANPAVYTVSLAWCLKDGSVLCEKQLQYRGVRTFAPLPGYENFEKRRREALEYLANQGNPLALYRLNRAGEISFEKIDEKCKKIERMADCADFELLPLLWLIWEDRGAKRLDPRIKESIKKAALGFRYWVDEPNASTMFYCSENHRIGFHVSEYLAGLLYPADIFTNCGQNGMYHSLKGRMHLVEWLSQRCKFGFDEPHSDNYMPVTMSALLCLREVLPLEEYPLRNMVNVLLDFMSYIFATSNFDGCTATPRGRSYNAPLRCKYASSMNNIFWIFFGNAKGVGGGFNQELAFSFYVPPKGICDIAYDKTPTTFTFKEGLMHFDKHNADFTIRRTADYMLGAVRDHNVGACDMHFISAMIALKGDISIFFSAPNNAAEGSGLRPDYWAGQAFLPRVIMSGRTMAVIWHNVNDPVIWMTHCYFPSKKFDEVIQRDGWTFGRKENGYVAIYSSTPHSFREEGLYAGRELIADGNETVWLVECGSRDEDGDFAAFVEKMLNAKITRDGEDFTFASPGSGLFEFGLTEGFTVDGKPVPIPEYLAKSPYLTSKFGSGRFDYTCKDFNVTQWSYPASI